MTKKRNVNMNQKKSRQTRKKRRIADEIESPSEQVLANVPGDLISMVRDNWRRIHSHTVYYRRLRLYNFKLISNDENKKNILNLVLACDGLGVEGPSGLVKTQLTLLMVVYFSKYDDNYNSRTTERRTNQENVGGIPSETSLVHIREPSAQRVLAVSCLDAEHVGTHVSG